MFLGRPLERHRSPRGRASYSALFEWRTVARWRGLTWEYFRRLAPDDQAAYIAEYRTTLKLDGLEAREAQKDAERHARRARRFGRSRV